MSPYPILSKGSPRREFSQHVLTFLDLGCWCIFPSHAVTHLGISCMHLTQPLCLQWDKPPKTIQSVVEQWWHSPKMLEKQRVINKVNLYNATHQGGSIPNMHPFELWNSYISLRCSPFLYLKNLIRYDFAQTETVLLENAPSSMNAVVCGASSVEEIWNPFPVKFIVYMWSFLFVAFYVETLMW